MTSNGAEARVQEQIEVWARELIDLSRRNKSLFYKAIKNGTVEVLRPGCVDLFNRLNSRHQLSIYLPPQRTEDQEPWTRDASLAAAGRDELVTDRSEGASVRSALRSMFRAANQDTLDRGVHSLYATFGMLRWYESADEGPVLSPLVFVPVSFVREGVSDEYQIVRSDEDAVLNPALQVKLENDFGLNLGGADLDPQQTDDLRGLLDRVRDLVSDRKWTVEDRVIIKRATFHKEAMYRDLLDNAGTIADNTIVQSLAGLSTVSTSPVRLSDRVPSEGELDAARPPEDAHLILDADASQRRAIEAARRGVSFVMDGPPGTGKSQTIANMIAELLSEGKTVLFVSEKAAALEVVHNRLQRRGLEPFLLELHSHKSSRKAVVAELSMALQTRPAARPRLTDADRQRARRLRGTLGEYANDVNRNRAPLGRSVTWVAGRLGQLHKAATLPDISNGAELTPDRAIDCIALSATLAECWTPVTDDEFAWHGFAGINYGLRERTDLDRLLRDLDGALTAVDDSAADLAHRLGATPAQTVLQARGLATLAGHAAASPPNKSAWMAQPPSTVRGHLTTKVEQQRQWRDCKDELAADVGPLWPTMPEEPVLGGLLDQLAQMSPPLQVSDAADADLLGALLDAAAAMGATIKADHDLIARVVDLLGLATRDRTPAEVLDLLDVAARLDTPVRAEPDWAIPAVLERVQHAVELLEPLTASFQESTTTLNETFAPEVLDLDLQTLVTRIETNGGIRRLGRVYRESKKQLVPHTRGGKLTKQVKAQLRDALDAKNTREQLDQAEAEHGKLLGHHYRPRGTDGTAVSEALSHLTFAISRLGADYDAKAIGSRFSTGSDIDPLLATQAAECAARWRACLTALVVAAPSLGPAQARLDVLTEALVAISKLLPTVIQELRLCEELLGRRPMTQHRAALDNRARVAGVEREWERDSASDTDRLGTAFEGLETDFSTIAAHVGWLEELWELHGPVDGAAAERIASLTSGRPLTDDLAKYDRLSEQLAAYLTAEAGVSMGKLCNGRFEDAHDMLLERLDRLDEPEMLVRHRATIDALTTHGLGEAVERAAADAIPSDALPDALEAAMYRGWIEVQLGQGVLADFDRNRHDDGVVTFRDLDRQILTDAAERLVQVCNERRPTSTIGAAATIQREAAKKSRHKPVRTLLSETVDLVTALKPCFMMSPLSVSQYLPPSFRFDVVIFDEASQITPSDAINCIYRGDQLIVAGDENQLPPTSFFSSGTMDDDDSWEDEGFDDFESVLALAKGADAIESLPLRWHYRSAHESLITFSNYQFYDGQLVTYPSAAEHSPDLGVELITVDGVYRRGGRRDNAIEAAEVARRVEHHAREHPDLSVGVVAFSKAQADAVEDAIDQLRREQPDLEDYFGESRLDGFFVKNLETVQGDERDIIIFTIGYGPDEVGKMTNNFGPINRDGGWRRLNVAVTRARRRVEVVNSFDPSAMDTSGSGSRGLRELHRYLNYASQGIGALAIDVSASEGDLESPLEESIFAAIRGWGYDVVPQVGSAGYRIDMGVRDPDKPGRFMLGIEADGAAYHSSKVARDRDRLRQEVLEGLGWRLHRIWGPSWYRNRPAEEARLQQALLAAAADDEVVRDTRYSETYVPREAEAVDLSAAPDWCSPYQVAELTGMAHGRAETDLPALTRNIAEIIRVEAPVHLDIIGRRLADHHGHSLTKRTKEAVRRATMALAQREAGVVIRDEFVYSNGGTSVRMPTPDGRSQRSISEIPNEEIDLALGHHLAAARTATTKELLDAVKELFGFARLGSKIEAALTDSLSRLMAEEVIEDRDGDRVTYVGDAP